MLLLLILFGLAANSLGGRTPPSCQAPRCGDQEQYVVNSDACRKTCANQFVFDKNGPCKPYTGCVCKGDLARLNDDATGPCVPVCQCKTKCGDLEQYVENSNACQKTCANRQSLDTAGACKPYTGCICKGDLVRLYENGTGPCVKESKCSPEQKCGYNEVWSAQKKYCPPDTCTSLNGIALPCAPPPKLPGCNCKENYLRNSSGICIPIKECPQKCGYNEVWSTEKKTCPPETCESQYIHVPCAYPVATPGCNCIENYLRNFSGICIPIKECPPRPAEQCGYNEIWSEQQISCPPQTCESLYLDGAVYPCPNPPQIAGCNCLENHLRNSSGICVPIEECPPRPAEECGYNEVWSNVKRSCPPETCESQYLDYPCAYPVPRPGCNCIENHLRNSSGICIPIGECPPRPAEQCGYNEIWAEQRIFCPPQNCESLYLDGAVYPCANSPQIPGCNCMENHLRNSSGICIPAEECPPRPAEKCGYNEIWSEQKRFCPPETCESQYTDPRLLACPNPPRMPGCNCMENHLRNSSGICIPIEECPPRPAEECGYNEVWSNEKRSCPPETCESQYLDYPCAYPVPRPGCNCIENHLRNSSGICIPIGECPPRPAEQCGYNEIWAEQKIFCPPQNCESLYLDGALYPCAYPPKVPGCNCMENHLRNSSGICIPAVECPPRPAEECGYNEVWSEEKRSCPPETCDSQYFNYPCAYPVPRPGCNCIENHLRNSSGICIPIGECPPRPLQCGINEVESDDKIKCPPQSCASIYTSYLCQQPPPPKERGCNCIDGYLRNASEICIPSEQCSIPGGDNEPEPTDESGSSSSESSSYEDECDDNGNRGCNGDPNAINKTCPNPCPATCDNPKPSEVCIAVCLPAGCECKPGYVLSKKGRCILPKQCPVKPGCKGDPNAITKKCPNPCPPTCDNPKPRGVCKKACVASGCECKPGYVLSKKGKCILIKQCPVKPGCNGDPNAITKKCPNPCPPTCDNPKPSGVCKKACVASGCECKPGYVLSKKGQCILIKQCPVKPGCNGDPNATTKECPNPCPPTCDNPKPRGVCKKACVASGCECKPGYVLSKKGKCILIKQCPVNPGCNGDPNATTKKCPNPCPPTCDNPKPIGVCAKACIATGCECNPGYVLSKSGRCILPKQCPVKPGCNGDPNATLKECPNPCQPTCDNQKPSNYCTAVCLPSGCECNPGYVMSSNGTCVLPKQCPVKPGCNGDPNATLKECPNPCQPTCDKPKPSDVCIDVCLPSGCECNPGYVMSSNGTCVLPKQCPVKPGCNGDPNATLKDCPNPCQPTCDNPKPANYCITVCLPTGCECNPGYVMSSNGTCVLPKQCPVKPGCNGDPNATTKECPNPCPPTCDNPKPSGVCNRACLASGCECNPGYVLSKDGKCILQNQCPVNPTCGANEQFVNCKVECPNSYCPVNDNRGILICDPPYPCPSGCVCSTGYLRKSQNEKICIEASKCPPVKCTRQNEIWNPTPPKCLLERCQDANKPEVPCDKPYRDYTPKCVCQQGYYRNDSDICVPANQCPYKCPTPSQCRPTCAVPNPSNCPALEPAATNVDGCECQKGYILSEAGGKCIRVEECPQNQGCNGDPNAVVTSCPWACPATCGYPNTDLCKKQCLTVGCQCQSGYILSETNGKCILPTECNGGDPCGPNATFVDCGFRCPNQYCPADDSRVQVACKPGRPCPPGCACKLNYKRLSYEDDRCILAPDCPVRECTRPNEEWSSCPSECLAEECSNVNDPPSSCNTLVLNCQPKCICQDDYYRNSSEICVPAKQCPDYDPCLSKCTPTCAQPNPFDCNRSPAVSCCEDGYILSERGGKCIRIEDCPKNATCNGDPNAVVKQCPAPCPSTCEQPNQIPCRKACLAVGCECAPGYLRSERNGQCIKPEECPAGYPCRENEVFVGCKGGCPTDYCPVDDSRARVICETYPFSPCYSGCICRVNHKKKSREDDRCILSSDCPPVKCTRQNEEWNSCPSACLRESCADVGKKPVTCNTLVLNCDPRCVCSKGNYRNGTDICVAPGCC